MTRTGPLPGPGSSIWRFLERGVPPDQPGRLDREFSGCYSPHPRRFRRRRSPERGPMPSILMTALYGALVLGVLVFVHELGHFLVAKWLGVRVLSFSIGMGPRLFGFQKGGTDYRISILPLGGFVRMAGDSPDATDREGKPYEILEKPWWARALITAAG